MPCEQGDRSKADERMGEVLAGSPYQGVVLLRHDSGSYRVAAAAAGALVVNRDWLGVLPRVLQDAGVDDPRIASERGPLAGLFGGVVLTLTCQPVGRMLLVAASGDRVPSGRRQRHLLRRATADLVRMLEAEHPSSRADLPDLPDLDNLDFL